LVNQATEDSIWNHRLIEPGRIISKYGDACDKTLTNYDEGEVILFGEGC
jgi:hypothetical protein